MLLETLSSPDYRGMSLEERLSREAAAAAYLAQQKVASSVVTNLAKSTDRQQVRGIDMSLPANGTPVYVPEIA